MPHNERDRRALLWGGGVIAILLLYLLFFRGGDSGSSAEPLRPEIVARQPAIDRPATYATPMSPPPMSPPTAGAPVTVAPVTDVSQLRLYGLLSRGAVIGMADGTQRFVPIGREIAPGVILRRIEVHHAILATGAGEVRLGFDSAAPPQSAVQTPR